MAEEKITYSKAIAEALEAWEKKSPEEKAAMTRMFRRGVDRWILMWNIVKRIEKTFSINVMGIVREEIWKHSFSAGQTLAKQYKTHGIKDLYDAFIAQFVGVMNPVWFEFNDKVMEVWPTACANVSHFRDLGWTDEQIKETAPYYCLQDTGIMAGFNPKFEVFPQPRLLLLGDSHCSYRVENHEE